MTAEGPEPAGGEKTTGVDDVLKELELPRVRAEEVVEGLEMVTSPTSGHASSGGNRRRLAARKRW